MTLETYFVAYTVSLVAAFEKLCNSPLVMDVANSATTLSPLDWAKAITDYGITLVIAAIFLYVVFRFINIGFTKLDNKVGNKQHDKLLDMRNEIGEKVQSLLEEFVTSHQGERIQVIEFSNTVTSVAYLPFKYMTCTYEVCSFGIPSKGHMIDHMSTSLFTNFFKNLKSNNNCCLFDISTHDLLVGGAMYDLMNSMDQQAILCCVLTTHTGKAIGYISYQKNEGITDKDIEDIKELENEITALLGVMDN